MRDKRERGAALPFSPPCGASLLSRRLPAGVASVKPISANVLRARKSIEYPDLRALTFELRVTITSIAVVRPACRDHQAPALTRDIRTAYEQVALRVERGCGCRDIRAVLLREHERADEPIFRADITEWDTACDERCSEVDVPCGVRHLAHLGFLSGRAMRVLLSCGPARGFYTSLRMM